MKAEASNLALVVAWLAAVNAADADGVLALSAPDVEVVGPRGVARGREVLRDWLRRANVQLETLRVFGRGDQVVVEQHGVWRAPGGEPQGEARVASRFRVLGSHIQEIQRYSSLEEALAHAGLAGADSLQGL